jgi:hypothetical protein
MEDVSMDDVRQQGSGPWGDLTQFVGFRRTAGIRLSPDGSRLVAVVQEINEARSQWVPSLWEIPLDGGRPYRLTGSPNGETSTSPFGGGSPVFLPDNSLVYASAQPWPDGDSAGEPALWLLPPEASRGRSRAGPED